MSAVAFLVLAFGCQSNAPAPPTQFTGTVAHVHDGDTVHVRKADGTTVKIDQAAYADLRALPNRTDREKVMSAFFSTLGAFRRTFGTTMDGEVQKVRLEATARRYPSDLAYALDGPNVLVAVAVGARAEERDQHIDDHQHRALTHYRCLNPCHVERQRRRAFLIRSVLDSLERDHPVSRGAVRIEPRPDRVR